MGHSIAAVALRHNVSVHLIDISPAVLEAAQRQIRSYIAANKGVASGESDCSTDPLLQRLKTFTAMDDGVMGTEMVIEAVPENLDLKKKIFEQLDGLCPPTVILATNTSGLPITAIASVARRRERVIGTHFYMPAHLIPLVEVVNSNFTSTVVTEKTIAFLRSIGRKPVLVKKDIPGFIGNRLQHAIAREAISLLQRGIASAEDIDTVVRYTLGLRFAHTGPLEQRDLNGLDVHLAIAGYLYPSLENSTEPLPVLREQVEKGHLGLKTGRGFYNWEGCSKEEVMARKNEQLSQMLELILSWEKGTGSS
ncbi:MAG TPA: 3-hydroxyacyl-CoA dehydrogenase family protein [Desulfotomaculum sp.]|nr:3-hydroxyacyl-CoA dehydrogenase family protein [Desulfotomaculum sp.]